MTTDHYGDAIRAGAAALAKPYREPETIRAFTDEYPTLAAARVLDAALPHMRAAILAEGITPGPCPAKEQLPPWASEGRRLHALCDLRAGHAGQHEAEDEQWGHFRWTDDAPAGADIPADTQCSERIQFTSTDLRVCERRAGHGMYHIDGQLVWDSRRGILLAPPQPTVAWNEPCTSEATITPEQIIDHNSRIPALVATCEWRQGHSGHHQHKQYLWDECGRIVSTDGV